MSIPKPNGTAPTRWLITGAGGMLGLEFQSILAGADVVALARRDLDVTDPAAVVAALHTHGADVVVNAAAFTAVDEAETHEGEAFVVNTVAAANIARACASTGARLVQISTDYVFDGSASNPYAEDEPLAPASAYGRTKAAGEWAVRATLPSASWIVRTAWLYGAGGSNFVKTILGLESNRPTLDVVDDQWGQPTWTADVARQIIRMVHVAAPAGIYHATSSGSTTWYGFARAIFELIGADPERVRPVTSAAFPRPAPRPAYSVLGHDAWRAADMRPPPGWRTSLERALPDVRATLVS